MNMNDSYFFTDRLDPIETILTALDERNLKQTDIAHLVGGKTRISEILNKRRRLPIEAVKPLSIHLGIPELILARKYLLNEHIDSSKYNRQYQKRIDQKTVY